MVQPQLSPVQRRILTLLAAAGDSGLTLWDLKRELDDVREAQIQRSVLNLRDRALVRVHDWVRGDLERRAFHVELTAAGQEYTRSLQAAREARPSVDARL